MPITEFSFKLLEFFATSVPVVVLVALTAALMVAAQKTLTSFTKVDELGLVVDGNVAVAIFLAGVTVAILIPTVTAVYAMGTLSSALGVMIIAVAFLLVQNAATTPWRKRLVNGDPAGNVAMGIVLAVGSASTGIVLAAAVANNMGLKLM